MPSRTARTWARVTPTYGTRPDAMAGKLDHHREPQATPEPCEVISSGLGLCTRAKVAPRAPCGPVCSCRQQHVDVLRPLAVLSEG